jgi:hypothetical protein
MYYVLCIIGVQLWNELDGNVHNVKTINTCKQKLRICSFLHITDADATVCQ